MTYEHSETLLSTVTVSPTKLDDLKRVFRTVHYHPDGQIPRAALEDAEVWLCGWAGPVPGVSFEDMPRLRLIQLTSAGANYALKGDFFRDVRARKQITLCGSSGIHVYSIPQYVIAQIVNLYMFHHQQILLSRNEKRFLKKKELGEPLLPEGNLPSTSMYGKTAGLLGYGHIGRETARVLKAMNVNIIAANSRGQRVVDDGYIVPGTGDPEGLIPSAWYSTSDPAAFSEFLSRCDVLVASLPSTPATRYMLDVEHFDLLPPGAIFINVGRGDLVRSDDLLSALNEPNGLAGAAIDVTDPEPLPDGHPLLSHKRVIVTPHTSGDFKGHGDAVADLLIANVKRIRSGGRALNAVDPEKGY